MTDSLLSNSNTLSSESINSDTNTLVVVPTSLPLDNVAPVLNSAIAQNKNVVSLKFNDEHSLSKDVLPSTEDFVVKSDQNAIQTKWVLLNTQEKTTHLILEDEVKANSIVQVNYTQNKNASLQDELGNAVQSFSQKVINKNEFKGTVADGYIAGATVTITYEDGSTVTVTTGPDGTFTAPGGGKITASGGTDTSTGKPFTGYLSAPEGSNSINPITTLINAMVEKAVANKIASTDANANVEIDLAQMIAQAESQVASALGINLTLLAESGQSLSDFDPIKTANDPNADPALKAMAVETQAIAVQVNNILVQASSILTSADSTVDISKATDAVVQSFISKIEKANENNGTDSDNTKNQNLLQDSNIVKDIMKESVSNALGTSTDSNKVDSLNSLMDKAGEIAGDLNSKLAESASKAAETVKSTPQGKAVDPNLFNEMNAIQTVAQVDAVNSLKEVANQIQSAENTDQPIDLNKIDEFQKQADSKIQQTIEENKASTETETKPTDTNINTKPTDSNLEIKPTSTETKPTDKSPETKPTTTETETKPTTTGGDSTGGGSTGGGSTGGGSTGGGSTGGGSTGGGSTGGGSTGGGDTTAPTITSLKAPTDKTYGLGQKLSFTVNTDENVTVTGIPQLDLTIGSATKKANYVSGSGAKALVFEYTVASGDDDSDGIKINSLALNSGTLKDSAGNNLTLSFNAVDTSKILVDTVAPNAPTLSTTDSDKLINNTEATNGVQIDIDLTSTNAVAGDTVQLKLGSSNLLTAYTLTSTDITAKKASFTVKGSDLGSDGTKSITAIITDQVGNASIASGALNLTLNTLAQNAETITLTGSKSAHESLSFDAGNQKNVTFKINIDSDLNNDGTLGDFRFENASYAITNFQAGDKLQFVDQNSPIKLSFQSLKNDLSFGDNGKDLTLSLSGSTPTGLVIKLIGASIVDHPIMNADGFLNTFGADALTII